MADNEFGYTPWGRDWVRLAEPLRSTRPEPLLPRARRIARHLGVETTIEGTVISARIHRGNTASVTRMEVEPMAHATVAAVATVIGEPTALTDDMHQAIRDAGARLSPTVTATDCSCSARSSTCLHVFATYYDMARRIDETPRLALEVQGYFQGGQADSTRHAPITRWTPLGALDPAAYFDAPG